MQETLLAVGDISIENGRAKDEWTDRAREREREADEQTDGQIGRLGRRADRQTDRTDMQTVRPKSKEQRHDDCTQV